MKKRICFAWGFVFFAFSLSAAEWPADLYLGGGGFWRECSEFAVSNHTSAAWTGLVAGVKIKAGKLPVAGRRVEELRLVDSRGVLLQYAVWRPDGKSTIVRGEIPEGSVLALPVVADGNAEAVFRLYYGNPDAEGLEDFLSQKPVAAKVRFFGNRRLQVETIGSDPPWPRGEWLYRVPVKIANFSGKPTGEVLAGFPLREALRSVRNPEYVLYCGERRMVASEIGENLVFRISVPPRTLQVCHLYVREGTVRRRTLQSAVSSQGSEIPSDQILVDSSIGDDGILAALIDSPVNLLRNPGFESGSNGWSTVCKFPEAVDFAVANKGARLGGACAVMTVGASAQTEWRGWSQSVAVKSSRRYLYGAFASGEGLTSDVRVHLHLIGEDGRQIRGGTPHTGASISSTAPWSPMYSVAYSDSARRITFLLTMNGRGRVRHDGALLAEYFPAVTGAPERRSGGDRGGFAVMAVDTAVKIFPETPVRAEKGPFAVSLARGETEPLQLAVRSDVGFGKFEVEVDLPLEVEVGRIGYVNVDAPSAYHNCTVPEWELRYPKSAGQCDGWSGRWPDPVEIGAKGPLPAGETHGFLIGITAGREARAGIYKGSIVWKGDGKVVGRGTISVEVWDFSLSERPLFPAIFDVRLNEKEIPYWNCLGKTDLERREKIWAFMARKKVCPDDVGMHLPFVRGKDGTVRCDFSEYDRRMERYFNHYRFPLSYMPLNFYSFGWGMPPKDFLGEKAYAGDSPHTKTHSGDCPRTNASRLVLRKEYKKVYQESLRLYWRHVNAKGWSDRLVLYLSDEPFHWNIDIRQQVKALSAMIHEVDPEIRIYTSAWQHVPEWNGSIDVWGAGSYGSFPVAEIPLRRSAGDEIRWTTDGQMCLDTPYLAIERLLPQLAHKYGAHAYEFWAITWLTRDPWKCGYHAFIRQSGTPGSSYYSRYPSGDGYLIYPPRDGGDSPVSSIRLEAVRDGVEDYEYLVLLEREAETSREANALLEKFRNLVTIPNAGGRYSTRILPEPEKLSRLRLEAGRLLSRISKACSR
jgi:hypothetical protein